MDSGDRPMKIGVLALQGSFEEHMGMLKKRGAAAVAVRLPEHLQDLDGLIIPGGESTTIGKLADSYGLVGPLRRFARDKPVWGTCAGMIMMAKEAGGHQPLLEIMDIVVERNAFGRQVDSFECPITVEIFEDGERRPFPAIFIRAPKLVGVRGVARVIATLGDGTAVAALQNRLLATAFHPELSNDPRFHDYFLKLARHNTEALQAVLTKQRSSYSL